MAKITEVCEAAEAEPADEESSREGAQTRARTACAPNLPCEKAGRLRTAQNASQGQSRPRAGCCFIMNSMPTKQAAKKRGHRPQRFTKTNTWSL